MKNSLVALISVSDKTGIAAFSRNLTQLGYEIISTGGTAALLRKEKIAVTEVESLTGFPEILGGRVKTLHPKVFGGILAKNEKSHTKDLEKHGIKKIDLVCVNLYPFAETIKNPKVKLAEAVEEIDIGGVSLLRAAAKNFERVIVVSKLSQYTEVIEALREKKMDESKRRLLAAAAFAQTTKYDGMITGYLGGENYFTPIYEKINKLRYGENPHQSAILYREAQNNHSNITNAKVLQGKELSFNNLMDGDYALHIVADFTKPTVAVIKHANPCGIASHEKIEAALQLALDADKISPFGGIIAFNREVNEACAKIIQPLFMEVLIAPSFDKKALKILSEKKNLRLIATEKISVNPKGINIKKIGGGLLIQDIDNRVVTEKDLKVVTHKIPTKQQIKDLIFAANACKHAKSNAIVIARNEVAIGIGAGQTARVDAVEIALRKAGTAASGSVLASDAFFPFPDSVEVAAKAGISAIIQSGGSIRDNEVIEAANKLNVAMVFSGVRAFRH
ncbi:MAG: bifunctional phosphoribosylaminoimidazolecarboxamide formyltransferase/IMP cyclohydrolase [Candidatus Gracilibacteria bacterium]